MDKIQKLSYKKLVSWRDLKWWDSLKQLLTWQINAGTALGTESILLHAKYRHVMPLTGTYGIHCHNGSFENNAESLTVNQYSKIYRV